MFVKRGNSEDQLRMKKEPILKAKLKEELMVRKERLEEKEGKEVISEKLLVLIMRRLSSVEIRQ